MSQIAQQQLKHFRGWARGDRLGSGNVVDIGGLDTSRFQIRELRRHLLVRAGAGSEIDDGAFDHRFLDHRAGAQHHAREQPSDRMRGHGGFAAPGGAVAHGDCQLGPGRHTSFRSPSPGRRGGQGVRTGRRHYSQRQPTRPRPNSLKQMCEKRAAEHRHFGVGVALEGFEREGHAHRCASREVRALGERQFHLVQIGAARCQLHFGELAVAL